ncbi:MAG: hypothetical protein HY286_00980 [Planctomycetes bacterium]|nr:hypothetical protein [Planctomycetota bacterium]
MLRILPPLFVSVLICALSPIAGAQTLLPEKIWTTDASTYAAIDSVIWSSPPKNVELADDFDVVGTITRVVAYANPCFNCAAPSVAGVYVRFYSWTAAKPGTLQYEAHLLAGDSKFAYIPTNFGVIDVTLPTPFTATGKHYISIQVEFNGGGYWSWWVADLGAPKLSSGRMRDNLAGGGWKPLSTVVGPLSADLSIALWGFDSSPTVGSDPCGPWVPMDTPNPSNADSCGFSDIKMLNSHNMWAVGTASGALKPTSTGFSTFAAHFDGNNWTAVPTPNPAPVPSLVNDALYAVDAITTNDVWAAGTQVKSLAGGWTGQQLLVMHWDGAQWNVMNTPDPLSAVGYGASGAYVSDIAAIATNDIWFSGLWIDVQPSGTTSQPGLLMHWNGSSFSISQVPAIDPGGLTFDSLSAVSTNDVWAVGGGFGNNYINQSVIVHWNGSAWSHVPGPLFGWYQRTFAVHALAANDVYAMGDYFDNTGNHLFMIHWNGGTWTQLSAPPSAATFRAFASNDIYTYGQSIYHFDGAAWSEVETFPSVDSGSISAVDSSAACEVAGVGGQYKIGQGATFAARVDNGKYFKSAVRNPCNPWAAQAKLVNLTEPLLGTTLVMSLDDPQNLGFWPPSFQLFGYWFAAAAPDPNYPCGTELQLVESTTGLAELLIDYNQLAAQLGPKSWGGPAHPVEFAVFLPNDPMLAGHTFYTQGLLVDFSTQIRAEFSNAIDLRLGY